MKGHIYSKKIPLVRISFVNANKIDHYLSTHKPNANFFDT